MIVYLIFIAATFTLALLKQTRERLALLAIGTLLFIGFRYEVGTDWDVYKGIYLTLRDIETSVFLDNFATIISQARMEPGFLVFSYALSHLSLPYETIQVIACVLFLLSMWRLGRALGCANGAAALGIVHLFLLFSLEFSTLRQCIALSILNLGLAAGLQGQRIAAVLAFIAVPFFQVTVCLYVAAAAIALLVPRHALWPILVAGAIAAGLIITGLDALPVSALPEIIGGKLQRYLAIKNGSTHLVERLIALTLCIGMMAGAWVWRRGGNEKQARAALLLLLLGFLTLGFFNLTVLRNRLLYEMIVLASLLAFSMQSILTTGVRLLMLGIGSAYFSIHLIKQSSFLYIPYQNVLVHTAMSWKSDGPARIERMNALIKRKHGREVKKIRITPEAFKRGNSEPPVN